MNYQKMKNTVKDYLIDIYNRKGNKYLCYINLIMINMNCAKNI